MTSTLATIPVHQRTRATMEQAIEATASSPDGTTQDGPTPDKGPEEVPVPADQAGIDKLRVYSREMAILDRFRALGPAGTDLGMLLLAMGRGKLGRK